MLHYYAIFRHRHVVDLRIFTNLTVMPLKSPFFLAPQGMSRTCKSKLFHNPTGTTLADIYTEITPQNTSFFMHLDLKIGHLSHFFLR